MNGCGKSDSLIVPEKSANNGTDVIVTAEQTEGRRLAKGNLHDQNRLWTLCQDCLQSAIVWVRLITVYDSHLVVIT